MYEKAQQEKIRLPRDLIAESVSKATEDDVLRNMPTTSSMSKTIQRRSRKGTPSIKEAKDLAGLNSNTISELFLNGRSILWHDSGFHDNGRFLVYSTPQNVERLRAAKILAVDGTFAVNFYCHFGFI